MTELNQIDRIKIKLRLARNTDAFFEIFGASSHKYIVGSPVKSKEINDFEKKYNIVLPEAYKAFLMEIGNGGLEYKKSVVGNSAAGPDYGIFELGHSFHFIAEPSLKFHEKKPFFNESTTEEQWERLFDDISDEISDEEYDMQVGKAYSGILNIGFSGCSGYLGIVLIGKNKGRIVQTYDEIEYCPHFSKEADFLDWYENWLNEIIFGNRIKQNGATNETEESCVNRFLSSKDAYWKFVSLAYIRSFDTLSEPSIKTLKIAYNKEKDKNVRIYLLNLLTKFDYENTKSELSELAKKSPIDFLRNLHLFCQEKSFEWINEINKIGTSKNTELLEYINYVTRMDLKTTSNSFHVQ